MTAPLATRITGADAIEAAIACLSRGGLVAFPTETVYGLGADATDGRAVARLYAAKGRPAFNPLIAHVVDLKAAQALARFNPKAARLAKAFWPGPLTLVLPKTAKCRVADPGGVRQTGRCPFCKSVRPRFPDTCGTRAGRSGRPDRSHHRRRGDANRRRVDHHRLPRRAGAVAARRLAACR